jgi:hypothetical protein
MIRISIKTYCYEILGCYWGAGVEIKPNAAKMQQSARVSFVSGWRFSSAQEGLDLSSTARRYD